MFFEPLNPVTEGHLLVVPRKHVEDISVDPDIAALVMAEVSRLTDDMSDVNVITSKGSLATQTVPHFHVHIVPRRKGDGLHLPWTGQIKDD